MSMINAQDNTEPNSHRLVKYLFSVVGMHPANDERLH